MSSVPPLPAPGESRVRNTPRVRNALFWAAMVFLAVLLWKMSSAPSQQAPRSFSNTELQAQIDGRNVRSAHITVYRDRSLVDAEKLDTSARFQTYVSNDFLPKVIQQLKESGADVWIQGPAADWSQLLLDIVPFIILITIFVFVLVLRQRQTKSRRDSAQARPIDV